MTQPALPAESAFFDLTHASQFSGLSKDTLRRWIDNGRLMAFKPGQKILVDKSELERAIRSKAVTP
jgi:excisionase family DNA binding protein